MCTHHIYTQFDISFGCCTSGFARIIMCALERFNRSGLITRINRDISVMLCIFCITGLCGIDIHNIFVAVIFCITKSTQIFCLDAEFVVNGIQGNCLICHLAFDGTCLYAAGTHGTAFCIRTKWLIKVITICSTCDRNRFFAFLNVKSICGQIIYYHIDRILHIIRTHFITIDITAILLYIFSCLCKCSNRCCCTQTSQHRCGLQFT